MYVLIPRSVGITHVVNCTFGASKIPNFHEGKLQYYTFPISHWQSYVNSTNASVIGTLFLNFTLCSYSPDPDVFNVTAFATPMFAFIEDAISSGGSVLVRTRFLHDLNCPLTSYKRIKSRTALYVVGSLSRRSP